MFPQEIIKIENGTLSVENEQKSAMGVLCH